jgi:hypothetical protein
MPHRVSVALGLGLTLLVLVAVVTTQASRALPGGSIFALAADRPSETVEKALRERAALLAPILHPQLYKDCGSVAAPPLLEQSEGFYKSQCQEVRGYLSTLIQGRDQSLQSHEGDPQDRLLHKLFFSDNREPGVYLEIGALDGEWFSNTYFYEHALGWRGILVEVGARLVACFCRH